MWFWARDQRRAIRLAQVCAVVAIGITAPRHALAWYFPEHAELARLALQDFAAVEVSRTLESATADAAATGLPLCGGVALPFQRVPLERDGLATCISYGALTALAGDHSTDTLDLRQLLVKRRHRLWPAADVEPARMIAGAAVVTWKSYFASASTAELRVWTGAFEPLASDLGVSLAVGRRSWNSSLDVELTALDPGYLTRASGSKAHFLDANLSVRRVLAHLLAGDLDNALAQALVHHARSLELAVRSGGAGLAPDQRRELVAEALLEHAFAVHFLQDSYAAGHVATDPAFDDDVRRKQRHDYFNRQGLELTHALTTERCERGKRGELAEPGSPRCWLAHGDGFAAMADRWVLGRATARLQSVFAFALSLGKDEPAEPPVPLHCDADPTDQWLLDFSFNREPTAEALQQRQCLNQALRELGRLAVAPARSSGKSELQPYLGDAEWLGCPLVGATDPCPRSGARLGPGLGRLWRPLLQDAPTSTARTETLEGSDNLDRGLGWQLVGQVGVRCLMGDLACGAGALATVSSLGGLGWRASGVLPRRRGVALVELNAGLTGAVRLGNGPGDRWETGVVGELRVPFTTLLAWSAAYAWSSRTPLKLFNEPFSLGIFGVRALGQPSGNGAGLRGWDVEVLDVRLNKRDERRPAARSGPMDSELRVHLGCVNPNAAMRRLNDGYFTINAELVAGYYGFW